MVHKFRQEVKPENLQTTLVQYIKQNKDQEKLGEFCSELMAAQKTRRDMEKAKELQRMKSLHSKFKRQRNESQESPVASQRDSINLQVKFDIVEMTSISPNEQSIDGTMKQAAIHRSLPARQSTQNQLMVQQFLQQKEQEETQKKEQEEAEKLIQKTQTKKVQGSTFDLTREERNNILDALDNMQELRASYNTNMEKHRQDFQVAKQEKMKKTDINEYFKQKAID